METVRRRVDHKDQAKTMSHLSTGNSLESSADFNSEKKEKKDDDYQNTLFSAVAIPFVIILIFGGRYSLLTICFGGLLCYIFDLLGSVEVNN